MATESELHTAVAELLDRTPLRGDVEQVRRRGDHLRRRRRALLAGGAVSALLVFAGALLALDEDNQNSGRIDVVDAPSTTGPLVATTAPTGTGRAQEAPQLARGAVTGIAIDGNDLWLVADGSTRGASRVVQRWDAQGRTMSASITLSTAVRRVAVGYGYVWVFGGSDGGEPFGGITVIDREQNREVASYGWDRLMTPSGIAFTAGAAWVTDATNDRVLRLEMTTGGLRVDEVAVGDQPTDIIATPAGELWLLESQAGTISRVDTTRLAVAERHQWSGTLLAADGDSIWTTSGGLLVRLAPSLLAAGQSVAQGDRIMVDASAVAVDDHGIWVATRDGRLLCYSREALKDGNAQPTESTTVDGDTIYAIALVDQTLLYITPRTAGVARWVP